MNVLSALVHRPGKKEIGGAINASKNLTTALKDFVDIDFVEMSNTTGYSGSETGHKDFNARSYYGIPDIIRRVFPFFKRRMFNTFVFSEIPEVAESGHYDIIHIHNLHPIWAVLQIVAYSRRRGVPCVMACHGLHETYHRVDLHQISGLGKAAVKLGSTYPLKYIFRYCSMVFASSPADLHILSEIGVKKNRIRIVPNGYSPDLLDSVNRNLIIQIRDRYKIPKGVPLIFHLGEVKKNKGHDILLRALAKLDHDYHLVSAGNIVDPVFDKRLRELIAELGLENKVNLIGRIKNEEVKTFYQIADLFVMPSRFDTFPLAVIEAMAAGKAVIGTSVGGIPYQLGEESGIVIPPENVDALATAVADLLLKPDKRQDLAEKASARAKNNFTWMSAAEKAFQNYRELLNSTEH
jgi:glycosyltransferase involved in cell wall biosynthesis